jgi:hypothetical protein
VAVPADDAGKAVLGASPGRRQSPFVILNLFQDPGWRCPYGWRDSHAPVLLGPGP